FLDADGQELRAFSSAEPQPTTPPDSGAPDTKEEEEKKEPRVPKETGANRFVWNMRLPDPTKVAGYVASEGAMAGPLVPPGQYRVRLTIGDERLEQPVEIVRDPRLGTPSEDFARQYMLLKRIHAKLSETHDAINRLRDMRRQVEEWERRAKGQPSEEEITHAATPLKAQLSAIEDELIQAKAKSRQDTLNFPIKLNAKLAQLAYVVGSSDFAPTRQAEALFDDLAQRADAQLARLRALVAGPVAAFNETVRAASLPAIIPTTERSRP
ncbi:MAG TPA: hypothetical protein VFY89_11175, partial [Ktedonobacterales bacterium]